jgi:hypothetical protein
VHLFDFTKSIDTAKQNVSKLQAGGGGDTPEAVEDAMKAALELEYRENATKIVIMVSDAPPHGLGKVNEDSYPEGCPLGIDPFQIARSMVEKDIIVYSVGVEPVLAMSKWARPWFKAIAAITGGRYVPLSNASSLPNVIIFGAEEELQLAQISEQIESEEKVVKEELAAKGKTQTDSEILKMVTQRLAVRGIKLEALKVEESSQTETKKKTKEEQEEEELVALMTELSTMQEVRELLRTCKSGARSYQEAEAEFDADFAMAMTLKAAANERKSKKSEKEHVSPPTEKSSGYSYSQQLEEVSEEQVKRVMMRSKMKSKK